MEFNKEVLKDRGRQLCVFYKEVFILFEEKKCLMLAASSSFYIILTAVPLFLLLIRLVGFILGDINEVHEFIFKLGNEVFPDVAPEALLKIKDLVKGPLFGKSQFTIINSIILTISSLSFFNTIWTSIYLVTDDKSFLKWWKHLKGLAIIAFTVAVVVGLLAFHPVLLFLIKFLKYNTVVDLIYESFESARSLVDYLRSVDISQSTLFKENFLHFGVFLCYFAVVYRWLFNWSVSWKKALLASLNFVGLLLLGKNAFLLYVLYMRNTLMSSYGDFYTFIAGIVWIYLLMAFFFFGVCHVVISRKK